MNIIEWMVSDRIADNTFAASHIYNGLKLAKIKSVEKQMELCRLYRKWRPKTETKEAKRLPAWQAYDLVLNGIDPDDVEPRQIEMFEVTK